MFKQLNLQHILFYVLSLVGVVTLFNLVTAYAQSNLKASPKLTGTYVLETKSLVDCLKGEPLLLKIQQSGFYLNAALVPRSLEKEFSTDEASPLVGHIHKSDVTLEGSVDTFKGCPSSDPRGQVMIKAIGKQQQLKGLLTSGSLSLPINTVARFEEKATQKKSH